MGNYYVEFDKNYKKEIEDLKAQGMEEEQIFQMMKYFDARVVHFQKNQSVSKL